VYNFLDLHWDIICPGKKKKENWKKSLQDTLSHADCVQSGKKTFGQNGYWCITDLRDPWNVSDPLFSSSKPKGRPPKVRSLNSPKSPPGSSSSANLISPLFSPALFPETILRKDSCDSINSPIALPHHPNSLPSSPLFSSFSFLDSLDSSEEAAAVILSNLASPRTVPAPKRPILPSINI